MGTHRTSSRRPSRARLAPAVETLEGRICLSALAVLATSPKVSGQASYVYSRVGSPVSAPVVHEAGGVAIQGGSTDIDALFRWMQTRMAGKGDFLVLRSSNDQGYNSYLYGLGGFNSVATLDIPSRAAAMNPAVEKIIASAGALFIGGGSQNQYVDWWAGTPVSQAIDADLARGTPIGGTSAGAAVIGQFIYSAEYSSVTSTQALQNPFNPSMTFSENFLAPALLPFLDNTIVDTHFAQRDRMGRTIAFLARVDSNGWSANKEPMAIGLNEKTALVITPNGNATVISDPGASNTDVYFVRTSGPAQVNTPGKPLTYSPLSVDRVGVGGTFDLSHWANNFQGSHTDSTVYTLSVVKGVVKSSLPGNSLY